MAVFEMSLRKCFPFILFLLSFRALAVGEVPKYNCSMPECVLLDASPPKEVKVIVTLPEGGQKTCIFCHPGQERTWMRLWANPKISIEGTSKFAPGDLSVYYGTNVSDVKRQLSESTLLSFGFWLKLKEEHSFSPFNLSCIGLVSTKPYTLVYRLKDPELWYLAYIFIGVVIFFCAPTWSRNTAFHYTTGMTVGVLASVLIVMFILTRLMPQRLKTVSYLVLVVSSSASLFMYQLVKKYLQEIIQDHWQVALGYVLVSALISFALIYRFGPIRDGRTLNLVCWAMQGFGLFSIYQGTQIPEASAAIILLVIAVYMCPKSTPQWMRRLRSRLFPRRHRFLTEEEYVLEGEVETKKALNELRQYCRSPDCNAWKVISRLNSPSRFAKFVDGEEPHVTDNEVDEHILDVSNYNLSHNLIDDSDSDGEFSLHHQANHVNDGYLDSESEIEDTAYEGIRRR